MRRQVLMLTLLSAAAGANLNAADLTPHVAAIKAVGAEGAGNEAAGAAVRELSQEPASSLPALLTAFDGASPHAANYLRGAVEAIADRATARKQALPVKDIEAFVLDRARDPRARRLGYELLLNVDAAVEDRIIPGMLLDPSPDFRRDAVERFIKAAKETPEANKSEAVALWKQALSGATDADQVKSIATELKKLGEKVDLVAHFGFLTQWKIIGPFDNRGLAGFAKPYPPEEKLDFAAKYEGQTGEVAWSDVKTEDEFGLLDIAKAVSPYKGAVMYLATDFVSEKDRAVEFRLGTPNAWKVWLNGEPLFGRDEYHRGMAIDQYRVKVALRKGPNQILIKLCQNEQTEDWAQRYQLQFRVCESSGIAVAPAVAARDINRTTLTVQAGGAE